MAFHVGDTVRLTYGNGVRMRVEKVATSNGNEWVTCVWGDNNECHNYFLGDTLQPVESNVSHGHAHSPSGFWEMIAFWRRRRS